MTDTLCRADCNGDHELCIEKDRANLMPLRVVPVFIALLMLADLVFGLRLVDGLGYAIGTVFILVMVGSLLFVPQVREVRHRLRANLRARQR
jgi:hypothetical protein